MQCHKMKQCRFIAFTFQKTCVKLFCLLSEKKMKGNIERAAGTVQKDKWAGHTFRELYLPICCSSAVNRP